MVDMTTPHPAESTLSPFALDDHARTALFTGARSAIAFADRDVDAAVVERAWDLAKWGPTSMNTQPLRLVQARSAAARAAVLESAMPGNRPKLERAPLLLIAGHDSRFHDHHETTAPGAAGFHERFESNPAMRTGTAHSGAMLQLGYLIVALRAEGLAVRPYGGFDRAALDQSLMPQDWRAEVILGVGWPIEDHEAGERKGRISAAVGMRSL